MSHTFSSTEIKKTYSFCILKLSLAYLCSEVDYVIHCAASIRFDQPISEIMLTNFASTAHLLELAAKMENLKCFTYMSTAYVNSNQARHSVIEEKIYPLPGTSNPLHIAQRLLALPSKQADKLVSNLSQEIATRAKKHSYKLVKTACVIYFNEWHQLCDTLQRLSSLRCHAYLLTHDFSLQ